MSNFYQQKYSTSWYHRMQMKVCQWWIIAPSHLVQFLYLLNDFCDRHCREFISVLFCSFKMLMVIAVVSIIIPRNVRRVVGPSILEGLTGALSLLQTASMVTRLLAHS